VLPAVPSSVSTTMYNPQSFPPQQALGPSVAPSVVPPCTLPSVPQWPPFARALVPQLATVPAGQGTKASTRSPVPGYLLRGIYSGGAFPGHGFVAPGSSPYLPAALPSIGCCGARYPARHSEISCCDCFGGVYRFCVSVGGPRRC
jgi:hypothetical protein